MILPNVRASFGREEARWLVRLLADEEPGSEREWEEVLAGRGIDPLLDDPRTLEAILDGPPVSAVPAPLAVYVLVRRALLESGVESRLMADYVAALVLQFGRERRPYRIAEYDDKEYYYLVDIVEDLEGASGRRAFLLRAHLGNFALWLSGLFPDYIVHRIGRKGGPGLEYYEEMGQTGYRMAAEDPHARRQALDELYRDAAETFAAVRRALNRFSDRHLLPSPSSPVDRLLRQAENDFDDHWHEA